MSSSTHTPGPWTINECPQDCTDIRIGAHGTPKIASVHLRDMSMLEQQANARLIAAAPELLAALQANRVYLPTIQCDGVVEDSGPRKQALAAIAKATGAKATGLAKTITVTMPVEQAEQLVSLVTSMIDGLEPETSEGKTIWAATVGRLQVVANDGCVDLAMRGLRALREASNAAAKRGGE